MAILSLPLQPLGVANELPVASGLIYRWCPKGSEHLHPHGEENTTWKIISSRGPFPLLQSSCLWLGRRDGLQSSQLIPHQCIPVADLSTQTPFHSHTHHHKHFNPPSAAVGRRVLLSVFTAHQLQTKTKTEPKALPTFWPSLLSGCEMWLALLQKGSNDKNHKTFLKGPFLPPETSQVLEFSSSFPYTHSFLLTCPIGALLWRSSCQKQAAERKTMT